MHTFPLMVVRHTKPTNLQSTRAGHHTFHFPNKSISIQNHFSHDHVLAYTHHQGAQNHKHKGVASQVYERSRQVTRMEGNAFTSQLLYMRLSWWRRLLESSLQAMGQLAMCPASASDLPVSLTSCDIFVACLPLTSHTCK